MAGRLTWLVKKLCQSLLAKKSPPRYGGEASLASQKNIGHCNVAGRLAFAYKLFRGIEFGSTYVLEIFVASINIAVLVPS